MAMRPWWTRHDVRWVAVDAPDTRELLDGAWVTWASELLPAGRRRLASSQRQTDACRYRIAWSSLGKPVSQFPTSLAAKLLWHARVVGADSPT